MAKTIVLEPQFRSNLPDKMFFQWKKPAEAVLSISENSRSRSPHDQIHVRVLANMQFWSHNSI